MGLGDLPVEVLQIICTNISSTEQRLQRVALVCQSFKAAATAATVVLETRNLLPSRQNGLMDWLATYGRQISSLALSAGSAQLSAAPLLQQLSSDGQLPSVQNLSLRGFQVRVTGSNIKGVLACATQLTGLVLDKCTLQPCDSMQGVAALSQLRSLKLRQLPVFDCLAREAAKPGCLATQLVLLTELELDREVFAHEQKLIRHLSCFSSLASVKLDASALDDDLDDDEGLDDEEPRSLQGVVLEQLQHLTSLTKLDLTIDSIPSWHFVPIDVSTDLTALTRLQVLELNCACLCSQVSSLQALHTLRMSSASHGNVELDAAALLSLPHLQHLDLSGVRLRSRMRSAMQDGAECEAYLFLDALAGMQQLTKLALNTCKWGSHQCSVSQLDPEAFAALTSSSRLQHLCIIDFDTNKSSLDRQLHYVNHLGNTLPRGVWQHVFASGRSLPELKVLIIQGGRTRFSHETWANLVQSCPKLQTLDLHSVLPPDWNPWLLQQLTGLQELTVDRLKDGQVPTLTGLTKLRIFGMGGLSDVGLLQLTALRGLAQLTVDNVKVYKRKSTKYDKNLHLTRHELSVEHGPDVWVQLLEHCQQALHAYPDDIVRHQPELAKAIKDLALATQQLEFFRASAAGRAAAEAVAACKAWEKETLCRDLIEQYCWEAVVQGFRRNDLNAVNAELDHALFKSFQKEALPRIRSLVLQYGAVPVTSGGSAGAASGSQQVPALARRIIADVAVELASVAFQLRVTQLNTRS